MKASASEQATVGYRLHGASGKYYEARGKAWQPWGVIKGANEPSKSDSGAFVLGKTQAWEPGVLKEAGKLLILIGAESSWRP